MRVAQQERALRRLRLRIGADVHPRLRQAKLHVVLGHQEVRRADPRAVLDHEVDGRLFGRHAAHLRDLTQRLAGQRLQLFVLEADQQHALGRAGRVVQAFPARVRRLHFLDDALANVRLLQTRDPRVEPAFLHPGRHRRVEPGRTGGVAVHVGSDVQPGGTCRFDLLDRLLHLRPVALAGGLEVIDLRIDLRFARDADQLVQRFEEAIAFAAHVRDVAAAEFAGRLGELDQLVGLRVGRGRVDQRSADTERALAHRLPHEFLHALQLVRRRRTIVEADLVLAHRGRADERGDVHRHALLGQELEVVAERGPGDVVADVRSGS